MSLRANDRSFENNSKWPVYISRPLPFTILRTISFYFLSSSRTCRFSLLSRFYCLSSSACRFPIPWVIWIPLQWEILSFWRSMINLITLLVAMIWLFRNNKVAGDPWIPFPYPCCLLSADTFQLANLTKRYIESSLEAWRTTTTVHRPPSKYLKSQFQRAW